MIKPRFALLILLLLLHAGRAWALSLSATVDRTEATIQDQIMLTISVEGAQNAGRPHIPGVPAFDCIPRGSSTRMQIINGQVTSGVDYSYLLVPKQAGTFSFGPATLEYQGKTITSNSITLTISPATSKPKSTRDVFVTASVSNKVPYVNEQVIYTFKLYRRIKITNASLDNPSFEGFRAEPLGKEHQYETVVNGRQYLVTEISQALFPTREGTVTIGPAKIACEVVVRSRRRRGFFDDPFFNDSFFGFSRTEPRVFQSQPISLEVQPLPPEGKTPLFSNLVGTFSLATHISKKQLPAGDTTTLTITIRGKGNIKDAQVPGFPELPSFKVYDDQPTFTADTGGDSYGGTLTVKKALVPLKEGAIRVPSLSFTYFNPESGAYELCKSPPIVLSVLPPPDKEQLNLVEAMGTTTSKEEIKILGKDILPIKTSLSSLQPYNLNPWQVTYWILFMVPLLGYASTAVTVWRKRRWKEDRSYARRKGALKNLNRKIATIKKRMKRDDFREFYPHTSKAFKEFFGDKLNITGNALTAEEIKDRLRAITSESDRIDRVQSLLSTLESGQFGISQLNFTQKEALLREIKGLARYFDRNSKK